ncbi:peptidylprolyl isomerase [Candidatus Nanosalina sp. VS9-1]|uniref:peptidylprolyl isomerase n=1 Tax=Candidatus Nanosalina sp. VS9-1 TaxID=3388566 RepID=UPI0039DF4E03
MGDEIRASHILVDNEEHAKQIKLDLDRTDKSFAELAKEKSEGPSGDNGGDLGTFGRGKMVPEFEKVAFDLDVDEVSDPVETEFGWHIIKRTE